MAPSYRYKEVSLYILWRCDKGLGMAWWRPGLICDAWGRIVTQADLNCDALGARYRFRKTGFKNSKKSLLLSQHYERNKYQKDKKLRQLLGK